MKKMLSVLGTCILLATSQAQTRIEKTGNDVNKDDTPYYVSMIGSDKAFFYTLRVDKNIGGLYQGHYSIDQLNKKTGDYVKRIATANLDTRTDNPPFTEMIRDKIFLFTKFNNKSTKTCDLTLEEISTTSTNKTPESRVLFSFPTDVRAWYQTSFSTCVSPDSSKIGIIAKYKNEVTFSIYSFYDFKEISTKKISRPNDKTADGICFKIDNSGNLFYTVSEAQKFFIYQISANDGKVSSCSFNKNKLYDMGNIGYVFDTKNNQVYLHAMYYENSRDPKLKNYSSIGVFVAKVDKSSLALVKEKYYPFSPVIFNSLTCDKPEKGIDDTRAFQTSLTLTENSEILVEAEQSSMAQTTRGTNAGSMYDMSTKISFSANEIVISKLNSNLDLAWMKLLQRNNTYGNITNKTESTILFTRLYKTGTLTYYFIEHPKFEDKKLDYSSINSCETPLIASYPGTNVVEYSIDINGKMGKRIIFTNKKEWLIPVFYDVNLGNDRYLVRFRDDSKEHFSIFNLK